MNDLMKETLLEIMCKNNYSSSLEAVAHYLEQVYPPLQTMNSEEKTVYLKLKFSLEALFWDQEPIWK